MPPGSCRRDHSAAAMQGLRQARARAGPEPAGRQGGGPGPHPVRRRASPRATASRRLFRPVFPECRRRLSGLAPGLGAMLEHLRARTWAPMPRSTSFPEADGSARAPVAVDWRCIDAGAGRQDRRDGPAGDCAGLACDTAAWTLRPNRIPRAPKIAGHRQATPAWPLRSEGCGDGSLSARKWLAASTARCGIAPLQRHHRAPDPLSPRAGGMVLVAWQPRAAPRSGVGLQPPGKAQWLGRAATRGRPASTGWVMAECPGPGLLGGTSCVMLGGSPGGYETSRPAAASAVALCRPRLA